MGEGSKLLFRFSLPALSFHARWPPLSASIPSTLDSIAKKKGLASGIYCLLACSRPFFLVREGWKGPLNFVGNPCGDSLVCWGVAFFWESSREEQKREETWEEGYEEIVYFFNFYFFFIKLIMIMKQKLHRSIARYLEFIYSTSKD